MNYKLFLVLMLLLLVQGAQAIFVDYNNTVHGCVDDFVFLKGTNVSVGDCEFSFKGRSVYVSDARQSSLGLGCTRSMAAAGIYCENTTLLVQPVFAGDELEVGQVYYYKPRRDAYQLSDWWAFFIHRLESQNAGSLIFKGDSNGGADALSVPREHVAFKVVGILHWSEYDYGAKKWQ